MNKNKHEPLSLGATILLSALMIIIGLAVVIIKRMYFFDMIKF